MNIVQNNTTKSKSIRMSSSMDFNRFIIKGKLSEGSFGVVY